MSLRSSRPRRVALVSAGAVSVALTGALQSPVDAATLPPPLTGTVLMPDGTPVAGAKVTLVAEVAQNISGGDGTDGFLVGTALTSSSGAWGALPTWPDSYDNPVINPDGTITIDAEAISADGSWDKLFNFNVRMPPNPSLSATVPDIVDSDVVSGTPGGPVAGVTLSFGGVTSAAPAVPNPQEAVETDYPGSEAYDVADADNGDETGANAGKAPTKTCDSVHHVCYVTGDPGPCRHSEPVSGWRNMAGDDHTAKRWVPVQPIWTTRYGHEHYTYSSGDGTEMSIAYGGAGPNYAGGLIFSTKKSSDMGNDAKAGTFFVGYFKQQWVYRKQRQWCVGQDPHRIDYNDLRDSGRRRYRPEAWLGGLTRESATLSVWACHDAFAARVQRGQELWVAKHSVTSWDGFFTLFGVGLKTKTENDSNHKLVLTADDTTKFCPDTSSVVADANRVQEE
jgi:hypothetical protein